MVADLRQDVIAAAVHVAAVYRRNLPRKKRPRDAVLALRIVVNAHLAQLGGRGASGVKP